MLNKDNNFKIQIKGELLPLFTQILKIFDLFEFSKRESFVFNPELFKSFEELNFPDWKQYYPSHKESKEPPFSSLGSKEIDEDFSLDFDDDEKVLRESHLINEIRKLSTKDQLKSKEVLLNQKQADHVLACYAWMNFSFIAALFGKSPFILFDNAHNGDRGAILKLIQLDKSLIGTDWSMKEIKKAHLSGDTEYFKKLSKALTTDSFKPNKRNLKLTFVLVFGWEMGLDKLSNDEILDFVKDLGVYGGEDSDSLYKEIHRLGLRKRGQKKKAD